MRFLLIVFVCLVSFGFSFANTSDPGKDKLKTEVKKKSETNKEEVSTTMSTRLYGRPVQYFPGGLIQCGPNTDKVCADVQRIDNEHIKVNVHNESGTEFTADAKFELISNKDNVREYRFTNVKENK